MECTVKRRPWLAIRFSLGMLLFLTACVAGYLGGYDYGRRRAESGYEALLDSTRTYKVDDLIRPLDAPTDWLATESDFDDLIELVASTIYSDEFSCGDAVIYCSPPTASVVVSGRGRVHHDLDQLLAQLRRLKSKNATSWWSFM